MFIPDIIVVPCIIIAQARGQFCESRAAHFFHVQQWLLLLCGEQH